MGSNRIQKLLFSEYSDMEDTVLVESPFAETSRSGAGLRQVQIGAFYYLPYFVLYTYIVMFIGVIAFVFLN